MRTMELFTPRHTVAAELIEKYEYPWEILAHIKDFILEIGKKLDTGCFVEEIPGVWIAKSARISDSAYIGAPTIIDEGAEVRHCAFIRGSVIIGKGCVVGNSTEMKNSIIFDGVQVPHYNYVGDSILGYKAHLGAGAITSNVKSDKSTVSVIIDGKKEDTGLKKLGAMIGDMVEVGCNSVLCPGTVIGRDATVYPLSRVRGTVASGSIFKNEEDIVKKQ